MTDMKRKTDHQEGNKAGNGDPNADLQSGQPEIKESDDINREEPYIKEHNKAKKDRQQERITELENIILEITDKHLRLQAEFDNYRKRTLKEKAELIRSGGETVLSSILPVIDDFDRALGTMKEVPEEDPAKIGFMLIFNKFKDFIKQNNVREIEAAGADFDVDLHFAITKIPAPSDELKGKIVDVIEKGYLLNDKVLRYAKVVIGE